MKYAITFIDDSIEEPKFEFNNKEETARAWFYRHADNTGSLDMMIIDEKKKIYKAVAHQNYRKGPIYGYSLNGPY